MKRSRLASLSGVSIMAFLLFCSPASALCTGNCGGTEDCPECVFSAFFSYRCAGTRCRWCAVWECSAAAPGAPADELAQFLQRTDTAGAATCTARLPAEIAGRDTEVRVVRLDARL